MAEYLRKSMALDALRTRKKKVIYAKKDFVDDTKYAKGVVSGIESCEEIIKALPTLDIDDGANEIVNLGVYDEEELHPNCTVQVLRNSRTHEVSVGWWENQEGIE